MSNTTSSVQAIGMRGSFTPLRPIRSLILSKSAHAGEKHTATGKPNRSARFRLLSCSSASTSSEGCSLRLRVRPPLVGAVEAGVAAAALLMPKRSARVFSFSGSCYQLQG